MSSYNLLHNNIVFVILCPRDAFWSPSGFSLCIYRQSILLYYMHHTTKALHWPRWLFNLMTWHPLSYNLTSLNKWININTTLMGYEIICKNPSPLFHANPLHKRVIIEILDEYIKRYTLAWQCANVTKWHENGNVQYIYCVYYRFIRSCCKEISIK